MAIGVVFDVVGMTQDQYEQVFSAVTANGTQPPPGVLTHVAGPTPDGFCVMETWESEEALRQALEMAHVTGVQSRMFTVVNSMP